MPFIELKTNVAVADSAKAELSRLLGREIALIPGKSERWLMTSIEDGLYMTFAGSDAPCVIASVCIFGGAAEEAYEKLTASLCEKLGDALGVPPDRIYVKYSEYSEWGWNGGNF